MRKGQAASGNSPFVGNSARLPHAQALDGLRALAVCAVLCYHAGLSWLPGGFLGVEVFFVISGYLITSLLLAEWSANGRIDLADFWLRRARRLLPALFLLLLAVIAFAVVFLPNEVAGLRGDAVSGMLYVNNWHQIFSHKSYFESAGRPSLLRHLWSLAVEEQFYLLWPLVFVILMRGYGHRAHSEPQRTQRDSCPRPVHRPRQKEFHSVISARLRALCVLPPAFVLAIAGATAAACWMAVQYEPDIDPSRIYYGTDTRASGILIGAALAFLRKYATAGRGRRPRCSDRAGTGGALPARAAPYLTNLAGLAAVGVLTICFLRLSEFQPFLYRGGFVLTSLATAALIAAIVQRPESMAGRIFAWSPLRWLGVRSYGIYLWHFPVFMVTRPQLDVPLDGAGLFTVRLFLTVSIAALSYRFLELPLRQGAIGNFRCAWRAAHGRERRRLTTCGVAVASAAAALFLVLGTLLFTAEVPPPAYLTALQASDTAMDVSGRAGPPVPPQPLEAVRAAVRQTHGEAPAPYLNATIDGEANVQVTVDPSPSPPIPVADTISGTEIVAIGDSVMLGVRNELLRVLGANVLVDAEIGRQARHALAAVQKLRQEGKIRPVVILHLGANGFISAGMFDQIMAELADAREVLVLNVKVPRPWETPNNRMLAEAVRRYPKAVLVDWHAASENHPEIFWKDGHHLRLKGAAVYADLIAQALHGTNTPAVVTAAM